jgi:hypothetical protein
VKLKINKIFLGRSIGEVASGTLAEIAKIIRGSTGERLIHSFVELDGDVVPARVFIEDLRRRYREKQRLEMADVTREVSEKKVPLDGFTVSSREGKIAVATSRAYKVVSQLLPRWFFDSFDESLVDDLFNIAKEEGGKIWWLKLAIVASQFVVKFAWRRFGQRKATEKSSSLPKDRGDDEL